MDEQEQEWPGVKAAYEFVMPSYTLLASRFEAADNRLSALMTFVATLTLGGPILAASVKRNIDFMSPWFLAGATAFLLAITVGLWGRATGRVVLPNPMVMFNENLQETDWAFRRNAVYFAGLAFAANAKAVRVKGNMAVAITLLLVAEISFFLVWVACAKS